MLVQTLGPRFEVRDPASAAGQLYSRCGGRDLFGSGIVVQAFPLPVRLCGHDAGNGMQEAVVDGRIRPIQWNIH